MPDLPRFVKSKVKIISNKKPKPILIRNISTIYMIVFGNASGVNEGGIKNTGETISLSEYMNYVVSSKYFKNQDKKSPKKKTYDTANLIKLVNWIYKLPPKKKKLLLSDVEAKSRGYRPYYDLFKVSKRFSKDLTPRLGAYPVTCYWGDKKFKVCGFATGVIVNNSKNLFALMNQMSYLTDTHRNVKRQISSFLSKVPEKVFPCLLEHEASVIPERRGSKKKSKWPEILQSLRMEAKKFGAKYLLGVTFAESEYYKNKVKNGELLYDFLTSPHSGAPLNFYITDLDLAINNLKKKVK